MTDRADAVRPWIAVLWIAILIGLPALVAHYSHSVRPTVAVQPQHVRAAKPPTPPPPVEPVQILAIGPEEARVVNAAIPFSTAPNPAARPFRLIGDAAAQDRAVDCLAAAQLYEAGDDPAGQRAVAQVVLNRLRHPAFPKTVCAVVFQGAERTTGCQFTFTCDGALARAPAPAAWERARTLARRMLSGEVDKRVGYATHYHTDWVVPYWSGSLDKVSAVGTHLFFRWQGWWGTPGAFRGRQAEGEPVIARLAFLSPVHRAGPALAGAATPQSPDFSDMTGPAMMIGRDRIGERFGAGRLAAINSAGDAFVMLLDRNAGTAAFEQVARQVCAGRTACRLLGWTKANDVPSAFPVAEDVLARMSYAYIRATQVGLERSLYNCREFPDQPKNRCMRERLSVQKATESTSPSQTEIAKTPPAS
ncbi:MAG: cell wall hydrolase [Sphingobium sp.]